MITSSPQPVSQVQRGSRRSLRVPSGVLVNDVHSQLNRTWVSLVFTPRCEDELGEFLQKARRQQKAICVSGSCHSMGGQQFATATPLLDLRGLTGVYSFDREQGIIEVGAGMEWPELIERCHALQADDECPWVIAQKQTGADHFTLGGSLGSNVHGRGLTMGPLVNDVVSFTVLTPGGELVNCSRGENADLFRLVVGGYGLFGVVTRVKLRLARRTRLVRVVEMVRTEELIAKFKGRIQDGCLYGDFQFAIDKHSSDFLRLGVLSCYRKIDRSYTCAAHHQISPDAWLRLLRLAYTNPRQGFDEYAKHYLSTNGQTYWSDTHQLSPYLPQYAAELRRMTGDQRRSSLVITELYVPRAQLSCFMLAAARLLRASSVPVIYGTVRLIEQDKETFLAWARQPYACIVFNLLTLHTAGGKAQAAAVFRQLIDLATSLGGSFYLTYHRFASYEQVLRCYPQFPEFCREKKERDPAGLLTSDWYRHYSTAAEAGS